MEEIKTPPVSLGEISLEDGVLDVLSTLPKPLQDFLTGPDRDAVTIKISNKYNLHTDQAGEFQRAFLFMLMGIFSPEAFVKDLESVGIDAETVKLLANEVNEEVFKPLRAKERGEKIINQIPPTPTPVVNSMPVTSTPVASAPQTPPPYAGARPQPLTPFNLPGMEAKPVDLFRTQTRMVAHESASMVAPVESPIPHTISSPLPSYAPGVPPAPAVIAPVAPVEKPPVVPSIPPSPSAPPIPPEVPRPPVPSFSPPPSPPPPRTQYPQESAPSGGTLRTMATDMLAVNEHREPAPVAYKGSAYTPPVIMQATPPPSEAPKRPPSIPTMPASLAEFAAPPRTPLEPLAPVSVPPVPTKTNVTSIPSNELVKGYATDPYREAI